MTAASELARAVRWLAERRGRGRSPRRQEETCRLYGRGAGWIEAHLEHQRDGRIVVVAVPIERRASTSWYWVDEPEPWRDFERQAGLEHADWGPCRAPSAGV